MMKRVLFFSVAVAVVLAAGVEAAKISVNLAEGSKAAPRTEQTVLPGELAGAAGYEAYNWNNIQVDATGAALRDDSGAATGAVINFTVSNGWGDGTADASPNGKIARGYFDDGDGAVAGDGIAADIQVTNVPYGVYHVILLLSADATDGNWGTFTVNGMTGTGGPKLRYNTVGGFEIGRNALLYADVTGATLDIHCPVRSGTTRGTIAGFQIVLTEKANDPLPGDAAKNVPVDQIFSWSRPWAFEPVGYDVYMDPNEALVAAGDAGTLVMDGLAQTTLGPLTLAYDTTYLWRVDALEPNIPAPKVHVGDVWSFTTEKHPSQVNSGTTGLPAEGFTVRNPSFENVGDPGNNWGYDALDWYEENDNQTSAPRCFWEVGTSIGMPNCDGTRWAGMDQGVAYYQDIGVTSPGRDYVVSLLVGIRSGYGTPEAARITASLYYGGSAGNAADGVTLGSFATLIDSHTAIPAELQAISAAEFILNARLSTGNVPAGQTLWVHVKATTGRSYIDDVRLEQALATNAAWNPSPARGAVDVSTTADVLSWNTGVNIANNYQTDTSIVAHHIYVGVDRNAVIMAQTSDASGIYRGRLAGATMYNPAADILLPSDSRIYWRVDEELSGGAIVRGEIWSFNTELLLADITEQSVGAVVHAGGTATLSVLVNTATPESYQWFKVVGETAEAVQNASATTSQLVLSGVSPADEGWYYCRVSNNAGDAYSDKAFVVMKRQMGHWTFDGTLVSEVNAAHAGITGETRYADGILGQAWEFTGDPNIIVVADSADDFNFYPQGYTVSAWINTTQAAWGAVVAKQLRVNPFKGFVLTHNGANVVNTLRGTFGDLQSTDITVNDGQWHHIAGTYDAVKGLGRVYVDGQLNITSAVNMNVADINNEPLFFGAETVSGEWSAYVGLLDDVQIWNYALDAYEVATVYTAIRTDETVCVEIDPMDFDGNCRVDLSDFAAFAAAWLDCNRIPVDACNE
ncbi:MAG: immunoglobulin domain-containing protein [Phycisphaerae bacterium]|nr:immunoglobulin domain-containing protein [Phycisphaerae bacterium]